MKVGLTALKWCFEKVTKEVLKGITCSDDIIVLGTTLPGREVNQSI